MSRLANSTRGFSIYALFTVILLACGVSSVSGQEFKPGAFPPLQIGDPAAQNRIEIFNDFQCPASAAFFRQFKDLAARRPDDVLITFRNFPLRQHKNALLAAKAVEAAVAQGKFMEMMGMIYDNQETLKVDDSAGAIFATYAKALGLDMDKFELDWQGQVVVDRINFDLERAKMLGVNGTPWVMLNDRPMAYGDAQNMEAIISQNDKEVN